jgi:hypothetical protein
LSSMNFLFHCPAACGVDTRLAGAAQTQERKPICTL